MEQQCESGIPTRFSFQITRRRLMASGGAAAVFGTAVRWLPAWAQDAATPEVAVAGIPPEFTDAETNWPVEGGDLGATRAARGSSINSGNVTELGVAWTLPVTGVAAFGGLVANPIVVGDAVYIQDGQSNVYAADKATGDQLWMNEYNDEVPTGGPNGVAVGYGMVVFPLGSGQVIAVDAASGEEAWRTDISGPLKEGITSAPMITGNTVVISTVPGNLEAFYQGGQRGVVHGLDVMTGEVLWYFDTTSENLWGNFRVNSGGGLWHPPSVDDAGNLYLGVGNIAPFPEPEFPAGRVTRVRTTMPIHWFGWMPSPVSSTGPSTSRATTSWITTTKTRRCSPPSQWVALRRPW